MSGLRVVETGEQNCKDLEAENACRMALRTEGLDAMGEAEW